MNFDPKNFFIGLIDFFSIILPGAILTYLFKEEAWRLVFGDGTIWPEGTEGWMVFLLASYLLGHFIFLISTWLDEWYDHVRKATLNHQLKQLAWHGKLMWRGWRVLIRLVFKREQDIAVDRAGRIKRYYLNKVGSNAAVNTFQWSKARLAIEHPESLALVQRFEADSKFFRSLVIVLLVLIIWYAAQCRYGMAIGSAGLLLMAFWRYMEQRHKATNQAYWSIITLEGKNGALSMTSAKREGEPTHAGGVVLRQRRGRVEVLLVQASDKPDRWVLPKGKIECNEQAREAAVREVREESGIWAGIVANRRGRKTDDPDVHLVDKEIPTTDKHIRVRFYLMRAMASGRPNDRWRERRWIAVEEVLSGEYFRETKELVKEAKEAMEMIGWNDY